MTESFELSSTSASDAVKLTMANGWREKKSTWLGSSWGEPEAGSQMDFCKGENDMINYNSKFEWGNTGTDNYKWLIYKVVEE